MERNKFLESVDNLFDKSYDLIKKKNEDYSPEDDSFSSFRLNTIKPDIAILAEMEKKIRRITNLIMKETVYNESIEDSIMDLINYSAILHTYLKNNGKSIDNS